MIFFFAHAYVHFNIMIYIQVVDILQNEKRINMLYYIILYVKRSIEIKLTVLCLKWWHIY